MAYDKDAVIADIKSGMARADIIKKHGLTDGQYAGILKWIKKGTGPSTPPSTASQQRTGDAKHLTSAEAPEPPASAPKPAAKPITPTAAGSETKYFNLSEQVNAEGKHAAFEIEKNGDTIINWPAVVPYELGIIPIAILAKVEDSDTMWVNDKKLTALALGGWDITVYPHKLIVRQIPLIHPEITISKVDPAVWTNLWRDNGSMPLDGLDKIKKPFPDFYDKIGTPADINVYGKLKAEDVDHYSTLFSGDVYAKDAAGKAVVYPDGKAVLEEYAEVLGKIRAYHAHMLYMDFVDAATGGKLASYCPAPDKELGGKGFKILDDLDTITDSYMKDVDKISGNLPLSLMVVKDDIKAYVWFKHLWMKGLFNPPTSSLAGIQKEKIPYPGNSAVPLLSQTAMAVYAVCRKFSSTALLDYFAEMVRNIDRLKW